MSQKKSIQTLNLTRGPWSLAYFYPKMRKAQVLDHPGFTSHHR